MGNFNQGVPERAFSDVSGVTSPVADTSGVHKINAVTGAINAVGSVFKGASAISEVRKGVEQGEALAAGTKGFEADLLKAKDLADQEGSNSLKFNNFLTKSFDQSPLAFDVKAKMMKDFQATVLGKSFTEVSPEDQVAEATTLAAGKAGFWLAGASEEEVEEGTSTYVAGQQKLAADAAEMSQLNLEKAKRGKTTAERTEIDRLMAKKQHNALANLAANYRLPVKNEVSAIVGQLQNGTIDEKTAKQMLTTARGDFSATLAQTTRGLDKAQVDPLAKPLLNLYDVALANISSANVLLELNNANAITTAQVVRNIQLGNPDLVNVAALSSMVGNTSATIQAKFGEEAALVLKKNSKKGGKPADPTDDSEGVATNLEMLKGSAGQLDSIDANNQPIINIEEFVTNVDNVLGGSARYISEDDNPVDNQKILEWLADPQIGKGIKDNLASFSDATRGKLSSTLTKSAVNHIYPKTSSIMRDLKPTEVDKIVVTGQGNKVVFRSSTQEPWILSVAQKLNREVGGALSTYYNAIGNVTGDGFSSVFEREKSILWPTEFPSAGDAVERVASPEDTQDVTALSEGTVIIDEEGNRFSSDGNGGFTQIRSPANATSR